MTGVYERALGEAADSLHPRVRERYAIGPGDGVVVGGGRQWTRAGSRYIRLPGPLAADVEVRDRYDGGDEQYHVLGTVRNPLAGRILRYGGSFTQTVETMDTVPAALKPTRLTSLPPA
jgi:hypothetical protein